jgi:hypothetical protein
VHGGHQSQAARHWVYNAVVFHDRMDAEQHAFLLVMPWRLPLAWMRYAVDVLT